MMRVAMALLIGLAGTTQQASAARCRYDRTTAIYGQDTQDHIVAPARLPCPLIFRSAFGRSESSIAQMPSHGVLVPVGNRGWVYTPAREYSGSDAFTVEVTGEVMGRYVYSGSSKMSFMVDVVR